MALVRGLDISSAQTVTSWTAVAKAVDFVVVKATEGVTFTSSTWDNYYPDAKSAKILRGSYHYAHPRNSPTKEARHYVNALKAAGFRSGFDIPPALDIEETEGKSKAQLTAWCLDFLDETDGLLALTKPWQKTGVYLNRHYYTSNLDGARVCDGRWQWLAVWPIRNSSWPADSTRPTGAAIWQFTDRMHINGIRATSVDGDVARLEDLRNLAPTFYGVKPEPVPDPKPPTKPQPISRMVVNRHLAQIAYLQRALNAAVGSNLHGGYHDRATQAAIKAWQRKLRHKQTGWLTHAEFVALANTTKRFTVK